MTKTHGLSDTTIYKTWCNIKNRCYNSNVGCYKNYGGRGIKMCEEWKNDFMSFYLWAINNQSVKGLSIERVDVNGNYEPSNCRWATKKEQNNNTRNNRFITINGTTKTLQEWADYSNLHHATILVRLHAGRSGKDLITATNYKPSDHQSKVKGVRWKIDKQKWVVEIKGIFFGHFENLEEAIKHRLNLEKIHFPECPPQKHLFEQYGIKEDV